MSKAIRPWLRVALMALASAVCSVLVVGLAPAPASAAVLPGSRAFSLKVLSTAANYKGRPYRYGAAGPRAFDCSGYTGYVMRHALGKKLPRSSRAQYSATKHISKRSIRPGDLVFFAHGGRVYHVAIYAGGGKIWHAPYSGTRVRKDKIWTSHWRAGRVR
jgi:cell wall-associated NlpC family hydrolase